MLVGIIAKCYRKLGHDRLLGNVLGVVTFVLAMLSMLFVCLKVRCAATVGRGPGRGALTES